MGLDPDTEFSARKVSVRAEGHAELGLAAASAEVTLSFPGKRGWTWKYRDKPLMVVLLEVVLGASGTVGASISLELSIQTSTKQEKLDGPLGVKLFAGKGKVQIEAQGDGMELASKEDLKVTSMNGAAHIRGGRLHILRGIVPAV